MEKPDSSSIAPTWRAQSRSRPGGLTVSNRSSDRVRATASWLLMRPIILISFLMSAAPRIDDRRLWRSLMDLARVGATPRGGVRRVTLTQVDREGRDLFAGWCRDAGMEVSI